MRSSVVFGIIALFFAGVAGSVFVGGWIYLIHIYGVVDAVNISFSTPVSIVQQAVFLALALVFGIGGASLVMARK